MAVKHHKYLVLMYLKQIILEKMEEILLNLNQLSHIFMIFMSSILINMPLQIYPLIIGIYKNNKKQLTKT